MGCGCGKGGNAKKYSYIATDKQGVQHTFRSEIEARAYIARNGGGAISKKELTGARR
jgi:hypothetical protein